MNLTLIILICWLHITLGDQQWCEGDCKCYFIDNEYGESEFNCLIDNGLTLNIIESKGHFVLACEYKKVTPTLFQVPTVASLNLRFGVAVELTIEFCPLPASYANLLIALGVENLDTLIIHSTDEFRSTLRRDAFRGGTVLKNLRSLVLKYSGFNPFPRNVFESLTNLQSLEISDVDLNHIPSFRGLSNLQILKINGFSGLSLQDDTFEGLISLKNLSISNNGIQQIPKYLLRPLIKLTQLKLTGNDFAEIPNRFFAENDLLAEIIWYSDNNVECKDSLEGCERTLPPEVLGNCTSLINFYYSSRNSIMKLSISESVFSRCSEMQTLHITKAGLTDLKPLGINRLPHLRNLVLYKNNITSIHDGDVPPNITEIKLAHNPLNCSDCTTLSAVHLWKEHMVDYRHVHCTNASIDYCILSSKSKAVSSSMSQLYLIVIIGGVLLLFTATISSVILTSQTVRVWLYRHTFWSIFFQNDPDLKYDAFISYAEEDADYVSQVLLPGLEEGRRVDKTSLDNGRIYRCCDHRRDWMVGSEIMDNIITSVNDSSRTIIVLSSHFLKSSWAQTEFDEAYIKRRVIMILREDHDLIMSQLESHPSIKHYIETFTYLQENDPHFWDKLAYLLPHRKMKKPSSLNIRQRHPTELRELVQNSDD